MNSGPSSKAGSGFDAFQKGDKVRHIDNGDGVVTDVSAKEVIVLYDRRVLGKQMIGRYSRVWFSNCSGYLYHR